MPDVNTIIIGLMYGFGVSLAMLALFSALWFLVNLVTKYTERRREVKGAWKK